MVYILECRSLSCCLYAFHHHYKIELWKLEFLEMNSFSKIFLAKYITYAPPPLSPKVSEYVDVVTRRPGTQLTFHRKWGSEPRWVGVIKQALSEVLSLSASPFLCSLLKGILTCARADDDLRQIEPFISLEITLNKYFYAFTKIHVILWFDQQRVSNQI